MKRHKREEEEEKNTDRFGAHCTLDTQINIEICCKHWPSVVRKNKMSKYTKPTETEEPLA